MSEEPIRVTQPDGRVIEWDRERAEWITVEDDLGHPRPSAEVTLRGKIVTVGEERPTQGDSNPVGTPPSVDAPLSGRAMLLITQYGNEYALMENTETHQVFVCRTAVEPDGLGLLYVSEHDDREEALGALLMLRADDLLAAQGQQEDPDSQDP